MNIINTCYKSKKRGLFVQQSRQTLLILFPVLLIECIERDERLKIEKKINRIWQRCRSPVNK